MGVGMLLLALMLAQMPPLLPCALRWALPRRLQGEAVAVAAVTAAVALAAVAPVEALRGVMGPLHRPLLLQRQRQQQWLCH